MSWISRFVRDVVIKPWNGEINFTIREEREGELIAERQFSHKLTDNIDELYPDEFDPDTEERIMDNSRLRKITFTEKRRKKYIGTLSSEWHRTKNEVIAN